MTFDREHEYDDDRKFASIARPESEACVIATLIHHPDFIYYSENLSTEHFSRRQNQILYDAIQKLAKNGVKTIDTFNVVEILSSPEFKQYQDEIGVEQIEDLIRESDAVARHTVEEYQTSVGLVLDSAFRVDALKRLKECERICCKLDRDDVEQEIYRKIDGVMSRYSYANDVKLYSEIVDDCWAEILTRQKDGYAGIPFKFPTLNEFATIESGELFLFAAGPKQGKSIMLLNCAADLMSKGYAVMYVDSELNSRLFTARMLSHLTGIEYKRITSGSYDPEEKRMIDEKLDWLKQQKFVHTYLPMFDKQAVFTAAKKVKHTTGLDVLIIDYFKSSGDGDAFATYQELGSFVDMVKNRICGDMGVCGLGAVQATESGRIADSAKICRNASTIALVTEKTQDEIDADGVECGNKKLRIVYNRNGMQHAPGEYIDLAFNGNRILYEEAKQHIPQMPF